MMLQTDTDRIATTVDPKQTASLPRPKCVRTRIIMALKVAIQFVEVTGGEESLMIMIIDQLCREKTSFCSSLSAHLFFTVSIG